MIGWLLKRKNNLWKNLIIGRLNALSNSWTEFVNSVVQSDTLKTGVNILNELVQGVTKLTSSLGSLGTIGLGAGLFAGIKNVGINTLVAY